MLPLSRMLAIAGLAFLLAVPAQAQSEAAHPDLSGIWMLNVARTDLPKHSDFKSETIVVTSSGRAIRFVYTFDGRAGITATYTTDGEKHDGQVFSDRKLVSKASWKNSTLETEDLVVSLANGRVLHDLRIDWKLSSDGRMLTREVHYPKLVAVFDKQ
jgi:hypothetical protein